ncbi:glutamate--tRNA ligase, partial [Candidatus Woesearchaeota archaeon]|nr:glutamate--tRNA ligase [Candidatus Woesearchaeota archaeon]
MKDEQVILKYALQNAVRYDGKAQPGAVMGKVFSELKVKDKKELAKKVQQIIRDVNKLKLDEQKAKLEKLAPELLEKKKKEEKKELPELKNAVKGKVVTRLPPEPSKYNHIGHAMSFLINYLYAKKYEGKCILRFEDTNPLKATQAFVDAMTTDVLDYLDIKPDKVVFASDDLPMLYKYAERLIENGKAYVCSCKQDKMRELRHCGKCCPCRENSVKENFDKWKKMLDREYKEGEVVLRLKGDIESCNHCMRDPVIFRIVFAEHYRQKNKYCVWPMYDFENAIEDSVNGVTYILRSNEFGTMRIELQNHIKELLGLSKQVIIHYGRFNITGATTQG